MGYNNINQQTIQTIDDCAELCDSFGGECGKFGNLSSFDKCNLFQYVKLSKEHEAHYSDEFQDFMKRQKMIIPHEYIKHCIFYAFNKSEKPQFLFETNNILNDFSYVCMKAGDEEFL